MPRGKAKNPEADGRRTRSRRPAMPVQVIATMTNGKRITINGYNAVEERGFLKVVTGMAEAQWLSLSQVAHVEIMGVMQTVQAQKEEYRHVEMRGPDVFIPDQPETYVNPLIRKRKEQESVPTARALPPEKTKGPSSLIQNPDGSAEQVGAMMIAPGA
jgi:hypothetical protein